MTKPRETDVAAPVVECLRAIGWRVYQEVSTGYGDRRPDIVATWRGRLVWIVECKAALSWELLDQAEQWIGEAHRVSVAVPARKMHGPRFSGRRSVEERVCRSLGLGLFVGGTEKLSAPMLRPTRKQVRAWWTTLRPEHEAGFAAAGSQGGGFFTPFRGTVRAMAEFLREKPGATTKELLAGVEHHYGSDVAAARNMVRWIGTAALDGTGLCARRGADGWRWYVDPDGDAHGRCRSPVCAMPVAASCLLCHEKFCALDVGSHKCRCHGMSWCERPAIRLCACGIVGGPICGERHERCAACQRRHDDANPPPWKVAGT